MGMVVRMRVQLHGVDTVVFEAEPARELSLQDARRLLDAEHALNELTRMRVHIDVTDEAKPVVPVIGG